MICYIDMDGVLTNMDKAVCEIYDVDLEEVHAKAIPGEFPYLESVLGITDIWKRIDEAGEKFWMDLEAYPWAFDLYNACVNYGPTYILTSPSHSPSSGSGKMHWLKKNFGSKFRDYVITEHKFLLANPESVLIDDLNPNVDAFKAKKGLTVLFPQFWNRNHCFAKVGYQFVLSQLSSIHHTNPY